MSRPYKAYWTETEGKGEEDHISIHAPHLLCLFETRHLHLSKRSIRPQESFFFFINSADRKRRQCVLSKHFSVWRRSRKPVLRYALVFLFVHSSWNSLSNNYPFNQLFLFIARQTHASPLGYASTGGSNYSRLTASAVVLISVEPELMTS